MNNYTLLCLSEALSPITHASGTAGNESIVARSPVMTPRGVVMVPVLSGNAIRHRCIRRPGMSFLIDLYGLRGKLNLTTLNFLRHGGNLTESTATENTARIAEMQRTWPLLRLLGGSLSNQILAGSLHVWRGELICEENRAYLESVIGDSLPKQRLKPAEEFIGGYQYTRGDAAKDGDASDTPEGKSQLMIYSGQSVNRGAMFLHGFVLNHVSDVELGALLLSLALWQQSGGTVGGQSSRGHGRLATSLIGWEDANDAIQLYIDYAKSVQADAIAWLEDAFAKKEKAPKAKRSKAGAVDQ